jgi:hypothetical protein
MQESTISSRCPSTTKHSQGRRSGISNTSVENWRGVVGRHVDIPILIINNKRRRRAGVTQHRGGLPYETVGVVHTTILFQRRGWFCVCRHFSIFDRQKMSDILQESLIMSFLFYIGPIPTHNPRGIIITVLVLEIVIHLFLCVEMG